MDKQSFKNKVKDIWAFIKRTAVRVWAYLKVAKMEWIVMISVFAFDLISKALVENLIAYDDTVTLIPYVFNAHRIHNYNAAFGSSTLTGWMGYTGSRIFYCVFAVAASVAFILLLIRNKGKNRVFRVSLALFVAGAMGNCIDRMFLGYVRDFIEFVYFGGTIGGRTTWAYIFNIADVALVTGVILVIFYFLFLYRDTDKKKGVEISFSIDEEERSDSPAFAGGDVDAIDIGVATVNEQADGTAVSDADDSNGADGAQDIDGTRSKIDLDGDTQTGQTDADIVDSISDNSNGGDAG